MPEPVAGLWVALTSRAYEAPVLHRAPTCANLVARNARAVPATVAQAELGRICQYCARIERMRERAAAQPQSASTVLATIPGVPAILRRLTVARQQHDEAWEDLRRVLAEHQRAAG